MIQGQNKEGTPYKQMGFDVIFGMSLKISKAAPVAKYTYWHIDLCAGTGFNDRAGCEGSPLVFLRQARSARRAVRAHFCDIERHAVVALEERIAGLSLPPLVETRCHQADNKHFLATVAGIIRRTERSPRFAMGTCLLDPNGTKPDVFPLQQLATFAATFPRIDILVNINLNCLRSCLGCHRRGMKGFEWAWTIEEFLARVHRKHWMIRNPIEHPGHRFTMLIGRDKETNTCPYSGFHDTRSEIGRRIVSGMKRVPETLFDMA
jgi:hypothetical protein